MGNIFLLVTGKPASVSRVSTLPRKPDLRSILPRARALESGHAHQMSDGQTGFIQSYRELYNFKGLNTVLRYFDRL